MVQCKAPFALRDGASSQALVVHLFDLIVTATQTACLENNLLGEKSFFFHIQVPLESFRLYINLYKHRNVCQSKWSITIIPSS